MPYVNVEVWVEPEYSRKQTAALKVIINIARDVASSGFLPSFDADALDKAIVDLVKEFPETEELHTKSDYPADIKYREWRDMQVAADDAIGGQGRG